MMELVTPYLEYIDSWKNIAKGKSIFLDSDAIISLLKFGADKSILEIFNNLKCNLWIINPVEIELKRTDSGKERFVRETFLVENNIPNYPFWQYNEIMKMVDVIRFYMQNLRKYPSPTDLYLGASISKLSSTKNSLLLTGNTNDFPLPLFSREAHLILQNRFTYKILSFISVNQAILSDFISQTPA